MHTVHYAPGGELLEPGNSKMHAVFIFGTDVAVGLSLHLKAGHFAP